MRVLTRRQKAYLCKRFCWFLLLLICLSFVFWFINSRISSDQTLGMPPKRNASTKHAVIRHKRPDIRSVPPSDVMVREVTAGQLSTMMSHGLLLQDATPDTTGSGSIADNIAYRFEPCSRQIYVNQSVIDYLAQHLSIRVFIVGYQKETRCTEHRVHVTNNGPITIQGGCWGIYFNIQTKSTSINHTIRFYDVKPILKSDGFNLYHVDGQLFSFQPQRYFLPFKSGTSRVITMCNYAFPTRFIYYENWYVATQLNNSIEPRTILSTLGENLPYVDDNITSRWQWMTSPQDINIILTPEQRLKKNTRDFVGDDEPHHRIVPTPSEIKLVRDKHVTINTDKWVIFGMAGTEREAKYLSDETKIDRSGTRPEQRYISLNLVNKESTVSEEGYTLEIKCNSTIIINSSSSVGVFYGIQSLLSLSNRTDSIMIIPCGVVRDVPRFEYRGVHLDVARRFMPKETVIKLLDVMSIYKLNKFHFHLCDDEGWRIQIPGLPELTKIGANRCHDLTRTDCLMPQYGSGPSTNNLGSGFYTTDDYKEILRFAKLRHIQVIPEIDMPGHSRAAIKAMELRQKLNQGNSEKANMYMLSEHDDKSQYETVQLYDDNIINVCIESTYTFVLHVVNVFIQLHSDIQPLSLFHIGGDELPEGMWSNSKTCIQLMNLYKIQDLKLYFLRKIARILDAEGIDIGGWNELIKGKHGPYGLEEVWQKSSNRSIYSYVWDNIWETRESAAEPIRSANAGYKVVMSSSTHLYFDHGQEYDPNERGVRWATPYISTEKVFNYYPMDLLRNADIFRDGTKIEKSYFHEACPTEADCRLDHPENIVGVQGQLWTEGINTPEQMFYMYFPRVLALAERAWHEAPWEKSDATFLRTRDWWRFSSTVGTKEFKRLEDMGIRYRLPKPGASFINNVLRVNTEFPGLVIQYKVDDGRWIDVMTSQNNNTQSIDVTGHSVKVRTRSHNNKHFSSEIVCRHV